MASKDAVPFQRPPHRPAWSDQPVWRRFSDLSRAQFGTLLLPAAPGDARRSQHTERSRVPAESSVTSSRAAGGAFSKSPVSRVIEASAINTPRSFGCCRCAKSRTAMACPDGPVELLRALSAAAQTAAHPAEGPTPMTSTSVARSSVSPRLRWRATYRAAIIRRQRPAAARLSRRDRRRRFLARAGRNARAASIPRIQCGTARGAAGSGSPRR